MPSPARGPLQNSSDAIASVSTSGIGDEREVLEQYTLAEALVGRKLGVNETLDRIGTLLKWYRFEKVLARFHQRRPAGRLMRRL